MRYQPPKPNGPLKSLMIVVVATNIKTEKGYHHNSDQAARRPHIVFDLHLLIWGSGKSSTIVDCSDCSWHHFRSRKCFIKHALLTFLSISDRFAAI